MTEIGYWKWLLNGIKFILQSGITKAVFISILGCVGLTFLIVFLAENFNPLLIIPAFCIGLFFIATYAIYKLAEDW